MRNTTEEYLASLRPRLLAQVILLFVDFVRPWAFLKSATARHHRDWIRTLACTILMPWSLPAWRRRAPQLAESWKNKVLLEWLRSDRQLPIKVATLGVDALVEPLLRHIDPNATLIAAGSLWAGHRIRVEGKRTWIEQRYPGLASKAIVITDSEHDADLLAGPRAPILVKWPDAEYRPAFANAYLPFLYTQKAKRPNENYPVLFTGARLSPVSGGA